MSSADLAPQDPTGTTTLRNRFARDFRTRWRELRGENRERLADLAQREVTARALQSYRSWFLSSALDTVVEQTGDSGARGGRHWSGSYVRQAYDKGLRDARSELRAADFEDATVERATSLRRTRHERRRARQYLTAYYETEEVAYTTRKRVVRALTEAFQERLGGRDTAARVNEEISSYAENATNALAATSVVETANEAKLTAFELADGVDEVAFDVETVSQPRANAERSNAVSEDTEVVYRTAGDRRVCAVCASLAGQTINVQSTRERGMTDLLPPIHPNCRCYVTLRGTNLDLAI